MKLLLWTFAFLTAMAGKAFANPACAVCTVAIAGSLTIARKLGVDDCVVGVWVGAMLAMIGYWSIRFVEKRKWTFKGYKAFWMAVSLSLVGFVYVKDLTYTPDVIGIFYMDSFLFTTLLGAAVLIFSMHFYAWMKAKNGGHAHFPFEKVVVPIVLVLATSVLIAYYPICNCARSSGAVPVTADIVPGFD